MKIPNKKKNKRKSVAFRKKSVCCNCKGLSYHGHFVSPSLGESGFFICDKKELD